MLKELAGEKQTKKHASNRPKSIFDIDTDGVESYTDFWSCHFPFLKFPQFRFCDAAVLMLERIWRNNIAILRSIVRNIVINPSDVDDVLQEAFTKLLRSGKHFTGDQEAYNYIRRVVLNTGIDHYRSTRRHCVRFAPLVNEETSGALSKQPNPLNLLIEKDEKVFHRTILDEVQKTLQELPAEQREAIEILFNRNNKKIKDVCRERGIPYSTLRSRVSKGIDRIRSRLKAKGFYEKEVPR